MMTTLPTGEGTPEQRDTEQLKILSIFWYIIAALQALGGCGVIAYIGFWVLIGLGMISSAEQPGDAAAGAGIGGFFVCFGVFLLVIVWGIALLNFSVARSLPTRKRRGLCLAMAAITCLFFPFGTILGILTLIVLSRPSVKAASI